MHSSTDGAPQTLPADWHKWIVPEADLRIALKEDGSEHVLGEGQTFGAVYKGFLRGDPQHTECLPCSKTPWLHQAAKH